DYKKLKNQWRLILKNSSDLNFHDYYTHRLYYGMVSEYIMANYLIELSPELRDTYEIVNKLKRAVRDHNFNRFKQVLMDSNKWSYSRKVRTVLQTLDKYIDSIKNIFKYNLSNGPVEGINNKINNLKLSVYGYQNFRNLCYRVLVSFKLTSKLNKPKAIYYEELKAS